MALATTPEEFLSYAIYCPKRKGWLDLESDPYFHNEGIWTMYLTGASFNPHILHMLWLIDNFGGELRAFKLLEVTGEIEV